MTEAKVEDIEHEESLNIYQRIDMVRNSIQYLQKDAKVTGYKAITHDYVISAIRPYLIEYGIVIIPRQVSYEIRDAGKTTSSGNPYTFYAGMYEFDFVNIDSPTDMVTVCVGALSEDTGDKGPGGAISYAMKYALLKVFNIETGDNEESRHEQKPNYITIDQAIIITDLLVETKANKKMFLTWCNVDSVEKILSSSYELIIAELEKKKVQLTHLEPGSDG